MASMTPAQFNTTIMVPAEAVFAATVPEVPVDDRARVLLLAIAGQEGGWQFRAQADGGPAHGFWQFEQGGGVAALMSNKTTSAFVRRLAARTGCPFTPMSVWGALASISGDDMAFGLARLILWSDPAPLPDPGDDEACWQTYVRNWRPGKPRRDDWTANIAAARGVGNGVLLGMNRRLFMPVAYAGNVRCAGQVAVVAGGHQPVLAVAAGHDHAADVQGD